MTFGLCSPQISGLQGLTDSDLCFFIFPSSSELVVLLPWSYGTLGGFEILAASVKISAYLVGIKFLMVLSGSELISPPQNYPGHSTPIYSFLGPPWLLAFTPSPYAISFNRKKGFGGNYQGLAFQLSK